MRRRVATWLFALSLGAIFITNAYDLAAGTSRALVNQVALVVTAVIAAIATLHLAYAWMMTRRRVLG